MQVTTGSIKGVSDLAQVQDMKGNPLRWKQEGDTFVAEGTKTDGYLWEYVASIIPVSPAIVTITVKKKIDLKELIRMQCNQRKQDTP